MTMHIGRLELDEARREKFCTLVGAGVPRQNAAECLGTTLSAVTRQMGADPLFAEQVRDAEMECEVALLKHIRAAGQRSWRACVWLLERMHPERYGRGKQGARSPSWDSLFEQFAALIEQNVTDEALRERLASRLDEIALLAMADEREAGGVLPPALTRGMVATQAADAAPPKVAMRPPIVSQGKAGKAVNVSPVPAGGVADLLRDTSPGRRPGRAADFCNTSPASDVHERRALGKVCT